MRASAFRALTIQSFVAGVAMAFLSACSTPSSKHVGLPCVRKVEFSGGPQMRAVAERARQTGNQMYPSVCALPADGKWDFPPQFEICFKKSLPGMHSGEARLSRVCLNTQYLEQFRESPAVLEQALVHEMAHVAQHYYRPIIGRWVVVDPHAPFWWQEGIAD